MSVLDVFSVGVGPSSSHTNGPMKAAQNFIERFVANAPGVSVIRIELYGSLALTGAGHGIEGALIAGLMGYLPHTVDATMIPQWQAQIRREKHLSLNSRKVSFDPSEHIQFNYSKSLSFHPNGMTFSALSSSDEVIAQNTYYSIGGGVIVQEGDHEHAKKQDGRYGSMSSLLRDCSEHGISFYEAIRHDEMIDSSLAVLQKRVDKVWEEMRDCITRGCQAQGMLPGPLNVKRRAMDLMMRAMQAQGEEGLFDNSIWFSVFAMAVNEENACGGRIVTAPTNGSSGLIPAVLAYCEKFHKASLCDDYLMRFFLVAGFVGKVCAENASISGAEVGCQGEVGVACSMAAAGVVAAMGGQNWQIEKAAEMALEHHLGLTCDPVGGLVQIPCIERNALGASKAYSIAAICLMEQDHQNRVAFDTVLETMYRTGLDMHQGYKETSQAGLARFFSVC